MHTVTRPPFERVEDLLGQEIEKSRAHREPVSRVMLAKILHAQLGVPQKEAEALVERYCEEKNPAVPAYLSDEFGRPYLKIIAFLNVALSIGCLYWGVRLAKPGQPGWAGYILGAFFFALAGFTWLNSIKAPPKKKRGPRRR